MSGFAGLASFLEQPKEVNMRRGFPALPYYLVQRRSSPLYWAPARTRHSWGYFRLVFERDPARALEFLVQQVDILDAWSETYETLGRPRRARWLRFRRKALQERWSRYRAELLGTYFFPGGLEE